MTASLLKSPGLFSVFWLSSIMLLFGWSPLVRQLPNPLGPLIIIYLLCQKHQSQLAQSSPSCSIVFFNSLARSRYLSFFSHSFSFILWSAGTAKSTIWQILFFFFLLFFFFFFFFADYYKVCLLADIWGSVCMSKSHRSLCVLF